MMPDLKSVLYSIERCTCHVPDACRDCAYDAGHPYRECVDMMLGDVQALLKDPDRVRVVRCSDCRFWEPENAEEGDSYGRCRNDYAPCQNQQTDMNWYCADGERGE